VIFDTDGFPITAFSMTQDEQTSQTAIIQIECREDYRLYADVVADVLIEGKHASSLTWTNLETSDIDLTPWAGTTETFNIRFTTGDVSVITRHVLAIRVAL